MPFIASLPPLIGHMQLDGDPVRAAAEAMDPIVERRLFDAWDALALAMPSVLGPDTVQRIADGLRELLKPLSRDLLLARSMGYQAMLHQIELDTVAKDISLSFHFGRQSPAVQDAADQYAAQFVREIGEDTRTTLAGMIQRGVAAGYGPEKTAQLLRDSVGLTTSQAAAVQNYRRLLETGAPGALERALRDKRFDVPVERLAELSPDQINTRVEAYRRRYVRYRANTIARYETLFSSNSGSVAAVQSSIRTGILPATTVKTWMIAKDELVCAKCRSIPEIQPAGVEIDQPFIWRTGGKHGHHQGEIMLAPLHPSCRCTNAYRAQ